MATAGDEPLVVRPRWIWRLGLGPVTFLVLSDPEWRWDWQGAVMSAVLVVLAVRAWSDRIAVVDGELRWRRWWWGRRTVAEVAGIDVGWEWFKLPRHWVEVRWCDGRTMRLGSIWWAGGRRLVAALVAGSSPAPSLTDTARAWADGSSASSKLGVVWREGRWP